MQLGESLGPTPQGPPFPLNTRHRFSRTGLRRLRMRYATCRELIQAYLDEHLKPKASYHNQLNVAKHWLLTLIETPTRTQIRERHLLKGHGQMPFAYLGAGWRLNE